MATAYTDRGVARTGTAGSLVEAAGGIAVVVLSIISLAGGSGMTLPSIAVIILGAAMFAEGGAMAAEFSRLLSLASAGSLNSIDAGGGLTSEMIVGLAILVLGILAVIGIAPAVLIAVAVIAAGATMMLAAAGHQRLGEARSQASGVGVTSGVAVDNSRGLMLAAGAGAAGLQVLVAIAAIVLGIIALAGGAYSGMTLSDAGLLILGAAIAFSGSAITGQLMRLANR